jgi:rhodanese-related sulfurtransferase
MPQKIVYGYKQMVADAEKGVETIPAADAVKMFPRGGEGLTDVTLVDLRDPRELEREGRIPGAFHCPRGMLEFWIDPESPYAKPMFQEDRKFVFFCGGGWRSALAAETAKKMGLKPVAHIGGGFGAWREAGGAVQVPPPREKKA